MATYTVDTAGIQPGDTIVCATTSPLSFEVGPALVQALEIDYPTQDTGDLPPDPADTSSFTLKVGTAPNRHQETFRYNADLDPPRWVGVSETVIIAQGDTWAMDLGNRSAAQLIGWSKVDNPVPYGKSFTTLDGSIDLSGAAFNNDGTPTGVITVIDTTNADSHGLGPFTTNSDSAYLRIRDNFITYTGKTATTFTGCAVIQGSRGTIDDEEWVTQGYSGGWGFNTTSIAFADQMYAAGAELEIAILSMMNNGPGDVDFTIGVYWDQYDPGDGTIPATTPPSGGLGIFPTMVADPGSGTPNISERSFEMTEPTLEWQRWSLTPPTKKILIPYVVGMMDDPTTSTGQCLDSKVAYRWVVYS